MLIVISLKIKQIFENNKSGLNVIYRELSVVVGILNTNRHGRFK